MAMAREELDPVAVKRLDVPVAGGSLAVYRLGSADPLVLAVHGITSNSHSWVAVARALERHASLAAVDLRGRGRSAGLPGPYGVAAYAQDLLAVLDRLELEQTVAVGHSLGAYIVARMAADHPERVRAAVLVDGGLTIPGALPADPQTFIDGFLGPVLARLRERFPSRGAYHDWWRKHPAFKGGVVPDQDLIPFADHDLTGVEPELHSSVVEEAVRADADEVLTVGEAAHRLAVPATLLCATRGLFDEPNPMQPLELVREWAAEAPDRRRAVQVADTNHYTLTLGERGARTVAETVRAYL
jgi:pimeloyl-ACP methyl ester carboxylesterase